MGPANIRPDICLDEICNCYSLSGLRVRGCSGSLGTSGGGEPSRRCPKRSRIHVLSHHWGQGMLPGSPSTMPSRTRPG